MRVQGKRVIITGAASGIGRAGALLFAREGAAVVAVDMNAQALAALRDEAQAGGWPIETIVADLMEPDEARRIVAQGASRLEGLDVLWTNAGVNGAASIEPLDLSEYDRTLALNLRAGAISCGEAAPLMRGRGGSIVMTASIAGLVGSIQSPIYSASKFAVIGLVKSLALKWALDGIRVNAVCPGPIATPMLLSAIADKAGLPGAGAFEHQMLGAVPMGRFGRSEEIAEAALWLASDASSFVTGVALPVDGGLTSR